MTPSMDRCGRRHRLATGRRRPQRPQWARGAWRLAVPRARRRRLNRQSSGATERCFGAE